VTWCGFSELGRYGVAESIVRSVIRACRML